jgi:hypothetical protein
LFEEPINDQLIGELFGWDDVVFHMNDTSVRDQLDQMKFYTEGVRSGVYSPNEVAAVFGQPEAKGGGERFIQTAAGLIPLSLLKEVAMAMLQGGANQSAPNANTEVDEMTGMPVVPDEGDEA